jgi:uncharacterized protein
MWPRAIPLFLEGCGMVSCYAMRRHQQQITEQEAVEDILKRATICRLAMVDDGKPYIVPLNYGYADRALYIHCAREGRKLDILRRNPNVCFEVEVDCQVTKGDTACRWAFTYKSVVGSGRAVLVDDPDGKRHALDVLMKQFGGPMGPYDEGSLARTLIIRVDIAEMTAKRSK